MKKYFLIIGLLVCAVTLGAMTIYSFIPAFAQTASFSFLGQSSELGGLANNSVVTPSVGPVGKLVVLGTGSAVMDVVSNSRGMSFGKSGQQVANTAYLSFSGNQIGNLFDSNSGEVNFFIKSAYSFVERNAIPAFNYRYTFSAYDGTTYPYSFTSYTQTGAVPRLVFTYSTNSALQSYFVPIGQEDSLFGKGSILKVRLVWNAGQSFLYLNDALAKSISYTPLNEAWQSASSLTIGSKLGYYASDDAISDFNILSGVLATDTTPPVISNISASPSGNSSTVIWKTDENSDSQIEYGLTASYGQQTVLNSSLTISHSESLASLTLGTVYHYRVKSRDASGNLAISGDSTFTTATVSPTPTPTGPAPTPTITPTLSPTPTPLPTPPPPLSGGPIGNGIIVQNDSGVVQNNYPMQIGRPFLKGEITNFPQAVIQGVSVATQADIKQRWEDGSVKHAALSFIIPSIPVSGGLTITFQNQTGSNNTPLTKEQMLDSAFAFDAITDLGSAGSASARTMLANGDYTVWNSGPIATTIILADHSVARKYDIGTDSQKSFRPIFHATFWPGINKVTVRYIGEISNTEHFEDQTYNLTLKIGQSAFQVYQKNNLTHYGGSRWTKVFWIGGRPEQKININQNLNYIRQTKFLPNYDTALNVPTSEIAAQYSLWQNASKDLYDAGLWEKSMSTTGGRPDIGPYPRWTVQWFYTGDWRMKDMAFGLADLAAAWPMQIREGNPAKFMDKNKTVPGIGHPVSIKDRPSLYIGSANYHLNDNYFNKPADIIKVVGPLTNGGWLDDDSHTAEPFTPQYVLSGDYWYLEEMEFWSSLLSANSNSGISVHYGRGPTGAEGGIYTQIRGEGWIFRSRVELANAEPDGRPEKMLWNEMINEAIAIWEGARNVKGSQFENTPNWIWGNTVSKQRFTTASFPIPPVSSWGPGDGDGYTNHPSLKASETMAAIAPWMQNIVIYSLGRGKELGFKTDQLLNYAGSSIIGTLTDSNMDPYLSSAYVLPVLDKNGNWITGWQQVRSAYSSTYDHAAYFNGNLATADHGYAYIARAAAAMAGDLPGGAQAWNWIGPKTQTSYLNSNPKWGLVPRSINQIIVPSNRAPLVSAGNAQTIILPANMVTLTGTATDPESQPVTVTWSKLSGPSTVVFTNSKSLLTTATFGGAGSYTLNLTASDGTLSASASVVITVNSVVVDITPPIISNLAGQLLADNSVRLTWVTDEPASSVIEYGTTPSYGLIASSSGLSLSHLVDLTKLLPATFYNFRVKSADEKNNLAKTNNFTFSTLPTVAPTPTIIPNPIPTPTLGPGLPNPIPTPVPTPVAVPTLIVFIPISTSTPRSISPITFEHANPVVIFPPNVKIGQVIKFKNNPTVYLVQDGGLKPFSFFESYKKYIKDSGQKLEVRKEAVDAYTIKNNLGNDPITQELLLESHSAGVNSFVPSGSLVNDHGTIYYISGNNKIPFASMKAFKGLGYNFQDVILGDTTSFTPSEKYILSAPNQEHPWGSWLKYEKTVYYSTDRGYIPIPTWDVFLANGGQAKLIVPASSLDIQKIKTTKLPQMTGLDPRVVR